MGFGAMVPFGAPAAMRNAVQCLLVPVGIEFAVWKPGAGPIAGHLPV